MPVYVGGLQFASVDAGMVMVSGDRWCYWLHSSSVDDSLVLFCSARSSISSAVGHWLVLLSSVDAVIIGRAFGWMGAAREIVVLLRAMLVQVGCSVSVE